MPRPHLASTVLLVRPACFGFNPDTAATNAFQADSGDLSATEVQACALAEFDGFVDKLCAAGVRVIVCQDPGTPPTPDSIFPNNWVSFHPDGTAVLYPMQAVSRRAERRPAFLEEAQRQGFPLTEVVDLSGWEAAEQYLEGTGSLVLDHTHRLAYACRAARTHPAALAAWCQRFGYEPVLFNAVDVTGQAIYHTNVLMSVGENLAVICLDALPDPAERASVLQRLEATGHEVLPISLEQMSHFAGNMLQVRTPADMPLLICSEQAWQALTAEQQTWLEARTAVLHTPLDTIERYGGGSARCMLAEVFGPVTP